MPATPGSDYVKNYLADADRIVEGAFLSSGQYRVVDRKQLETVLGELQLQDQLSDERALALGKTLGAELLMFVRLKSYVVDGRNSRMTLDLRLLDVATSEVIATKELTGRTYIDYGKFYEEKEALHKNTGKELVEYLTSLSAAAGVVAEYPILGTDTPVRESYKFKGVQYFTMPLEYAIGKSRTRLPAGTEVSLVAFEEIEVEGEVLRKQVVLATGKTKADQGDIGQADFTGLDVDEVVRIRQAMESGKKLYLVVGIKK